LYAEYLQALDHIDYEPLHTLQAVRPNDLAMFCVVDLHRLQASVLTPLSRSTFAVAWIDVTIPKR
jgi:hypothetical protein